MRKLLFLTACLCGGSSIARADPSLAYVAETSTGYVQAYKGDSPTRPAKPLYSIAILPGTEQGLFVTADRHLFLADSYTTSAFQYAPFDTTPQHRYFTSYTPIDTAVYRSVLYVLQAQLDGRQASVAVYPVGQSKPTALLSDPAMTQPTAMTIDGAGNIIVCYDGYDIGVFPHGTMPMVQVGIRDEIVGALAVDLDGNLLVAAVKIYQATTTGVLKAYAPGATMAAHQHDGLPEFFSIGLTGDGGSIYVAPRQGPVFYRYSYPDLTLMYSVTDRHARYGFSSVAAAPAIKPGVWYR